MAAEARATSEVVLVERQGQGERATEQFVLVEYGALAAYATSIFVLVERELVRPCKPSGHYEYGGVDLTNYLNGLDLELLTAAHEARRLSSTGIPYRPGIASSQVRLKGDWNPTIDGLLGRDIFAKHWRTGAATFDDCTNTVRYEWANAVQVTEWKVITAATGKIEFTAMLRHNGAASRTVQVS